jgi:hypothetical protein
VDLAGAVWTTGGRTSHVMLLLHGPSPPSASTFSSGHVARGSRPPSWCEYQTTIYNRFVRWARTQLAEEGDVAGFSHAFVTFARAKAMNAAFVAEAAPAKVLNGYLFKRLKLDMDAFLRWEKSNPDWAASIKAALRDPAQFEHVVGEMAAAISSGG